MPHRKNALLSELDERTLEAIAPYLIVVDLPSAKVLAETHGNVQRVYFPHEGIISCVVQSIAGGAIETGMIGRDGEFGAGQALDHKISLNHVVVQVPGTASTIDSDRLRQLAIALPDFRKVLMSYEQFLLGQTQQTAACNAAHGVQARTCKWLLRMHRLVGDELPLTQEFLAQMMGVQRTSVSAVAAELQKAGMISYSRGRVKILDIDRISRSACECDEAIQSHYEELLNAQLN